MCSSPFSCSVYSYLCALTVFFFCMCVLTFSSFAQEPPGYKTDCHRHKLCSMAVFSLWCFPQPGEQGSALALHLWQGCVLLAFHRWKTILCPLFWEIWFGCFIPFKRSVEQLSMYLNSKMVIIFLHRSGWMSLLFLSNIYSPIKYLPSKGCIFHWRVDFF